MRCSTAIHACTPGNHGNNQSKEKGRWNGQLYRPDPPQEKGVLVYQEAQTFARKQAAQAWAKRRETELAGHGAIERANRGGHAIKDMIDRYLVGAEKARPLGKTKRQTRLVCTTRYRAMRQDVRAQNPQEQLARKNVGASASSRCAARAALGLISTKNLMTNTLRPPPNPMP